MDAETLGKSIGKPDGDTIRNIIKRKYKISPKIAKALEEKHNISFEWLRVGIGDMFKNSGKPIEIKSDETLLDEKERIIKILLDRIEEQSRTIKVHEKCIEELSRREPEEKYRGSG
jgi:hypothetical protein